MGAANLSTFIRQVTRRMAVESLADQTDRQLLARLLAGYDESVFDALIRRHGPMVYRTCWRVLHQEQDVEDAFQATFLVLAQNLRTIRKHTSLASWLHGVAHRVALKARTQAVTRRRHEQLAAVRPLRSPEEMTWAEVGAILDAELGTFPEKWRLPLVLCYLEGRTQDEAARELGCGKNTLRRRLDEARAALGRRLRRRGIVLPATLSAVLLSECVVSAGLPPGLAEPVLKAAACAATGRAVTEAGVSARTVNLTVGVIQTMSHTRIKVAAAVLSVMIVLAATVGLAGFNAPAEPHPASGQKNQPAAAVPVQDNQGQKADPLVGNWLLTLPAGFRYQTTIRHVGDNRYALEKAVRFSGVYELRDGRLTLVEPETRGEAGFVWELRGTEGLTLVGQRPVAKIGQNYLGATLKRKDAGARAPATGKKGSSGANRKADPPGPKRAQLENGLGFYSHRGGRDFRLFWESLADDMKLKGKVSDHLTEEQIESVIMLEVNMHVPQGDYLRSALLGFLAEDNRFQTGPLPKGFEDDRPPQYAVALFRTKKGSYGLLTLYRNFIVVELNRRVGVVILDADAAKKKKEALPKDQH
jgi:RNA polymerase sigma factor (sigma-70 family)